jgi:hypothetical protein
MTATYPVSTPHPNDAGGVWVDDRLHTLTRSRVTRVLVIPFPWVRQGSKP